MKNKEIYEFISVTPKKNVLSNFLLEFLQNDPALALKNKFSASDVNLSKIFKQYIT